MTYTNRHARRQDTAPESDNFGGTDDGDVDEDSSDDVAANPEPGFAAPGSSPNQLLLKNLRPRLVYLRPADRVLLELALTGERSKRDIARTMGIEAGTVTRRLDRLVRRLSSGLVTALLADTCPLSPEFRQLALEHFLGDQSQRDLADLHHMTPGAVSRAVQYVKGWYGDGRPQIASRKTGKEIPREATKTRRKTRV